MDDTIRQRLLKIKALADRGDKYEAILAKEKLNQLLEKYGLSINDLSEHETKEHTYSYGTKWQKDLMCQIKAMIAGDNHFYTMTRGETKIKKIIFDFTNTQRIEFEWLYNHYKSEYKDELKTLFIAFVHKHHLFGISNGECKKQMSEEETLQLMSMIAGLGSKTIKRDIKQIEV